jgi:DNA polymerase III epsilon subunit-like protein
LGIHAVDRHRALGDAIATAHAFVAMSQKIGYTNLWRWVRIP